MLLVLTPSLLLGGRTEPDCAVAGTEPGSAQSPLCWIGVNSLWSELDPPPSLAPLVTLALYTDPHHRPPTSQTNQSETEKTDNNRVDLSLKSKSKSSFKY